MMLNDCMNSVSFLEAERERDNTNRRRNSDALLFDFF